ncbi:MAG: sensor histidine kinase [Nitrospirae bacterium]|nr:sensor histidine kinase [Nitrospirota bacterium]MBI3593727.1 sensor histidine kinase [Nitrospirota bacterium]
MARQSLQQLNECYLLALREYLTGVGESALDRGYELGREAALNGVGVLEAIDIYRQALEKSLIIRLKPSDQARVIRAVEFLVESLSPFEVIYRGYREKNTRLRLLSERLQSIREEERARIARDIHDDLGRSLTCLKYDLSGLQKRFRTEKHSNCPQDQNSSGDPTVEPISVLDKTDRMVKLIDETIQMVRQIASALRPPILDDLGLEAAIEWQLRDFQARTGIQFNLNLPSRDLAIDQKRSSSLFRIFQEILTNTARHAQATALRISLRKKGAKIILDVHDNGIGITTAEISAVRSLGLLGMRERASFLGGEIRIAGRPGKGTKVTVQIPFVGELS